MRPVAVGALLLLAALLAGCSAAKEGPTFRLNGAFASGYTQADLDEFDGIVDDYSDDVLLMESEPPQFSIQGIVGGCEQLRMTLDAKAYIASVGTCSVEEST